MDLHIVILAAGQGKRMHSKLPKVLHPLLCRPMIHYVIDTAKALNPTSLSIVVGHGSEEVEKQCQHYGDLIFFTQKEQKGTADAVKAAKEHLKNQKGIAMILAGDVILIRQTTLERLKSEHEKKNAQCTVLTARFENPTGYGRVLRKPTGDVFGIREERDCSAIEKSIQEINSGIYCFEVSSLLSVLDKIASHNDQKEYYLTDALALLHQQGKKVHGLHCEDAAEIQGINDRKQLIDTERALQHRTNSELLKNGVTIHLPETVLISPNSTIENDVELEPDCHIVHSVLQSGVRIESGCRIVNSTIGANTTIKQGSYIEQSSIGQDCAVGPYAHLRPGSVLEGGVKIGNFVEVKKSVMGENSKASHLSYIGDAIIGKNVNLGCGFITCNYDGKNKSTTHIEDNVFVGSDSQTIAPVRIGKGSYIASGTTVTENVPPDSLAISRSRQTTKPGYAKKYRGTPK